MTMINMIIQSLKCRKFKNMLLIIQFTIGFTALLFGLGCVNYVLEYKKNVEELAALDTVHVSILEGDENLENPVVMLPKYRDTFQQVEESDLVERLGLFEKMYVCENPGNSKTEVQLYALNKDCIDMTSLSMEKGSMKPLKDDSGDSQSVPVVVSASMSDQYQMGMTYSLFYVSGETYEYVEIPVEVVGVLDPSAHFWSGGSTRLSENIVSNRDFILAPQFIEFQDDNTYSVNSLMQLSGKEAEQENKLGQIQTIFEKNQLEIQYTTLQGEVDSYYETQKVVFMGALIFAVVLLVLSLLGCIGAVLAGIAARYREFGIYYSLGFTKRNMIYLVQGEIMVLFGFSFLIATGISKLAVQAVISDSALSINLPVILTAFTIMFLCMILCALAPFLKLKNMEAVEMMKGEKQ